MPVARQVAPEDIPHPYRGLLSHRSDMTQVLERHYGGRIIVRALSTSQRSRWYTRRVLLVQEYSGRPVEMGAIRIRLDVFSARVQGQILKGHLPLGRIMRDAALDYHSHAARLLRDHAELGHDGRVLDARASRRCTAVRRKSRSEGRSLETSSKSSRWSEHTLRRRVNFYELDSAGIVHFSTFFRYMEEAEHALWRAAGLSIAPRDAVVGFPRVAAAFEYRRPLRFEDEFDVRIRIVESDRQSDPLRLRALAGRARASRPAR